MRLFDGLSWRGRGHEVVGLSSMATLGTGNEFCCNSQGAAHDITTMLL